MGKMYECLECKGTGKIKYSYQEMGKETTNHTMECFDCDGVGEVDQEMHEEQVYERDMWCTCGNPSERSRYYGDGESEPIKHHYKCADCGKVTQIG